VATVALAMNATPAEQAPHGATGAGMRKVLDMTTGVASDWLLYERAALVSGASFDGPAIVAEAETSTLAGPGWTGRITGEGYIELQRQVTR
jgi:N-methylhydantoinase A